ncbi:trypsin-like peptidase domain-containing protein [Streptomyces sp. NPDC003362]
MGRVPERLAEVWATDDRHVKGHSGSGWVVGDRGVLTAWHVLKPFEGPGTVLQARPGRSRTAGDWCDCEVCWCAPELDVALLEIVTGAWQPPDHPSVLADTGDRPLTCDTVGFPEAERRTEGIRNSEHAQGLLLPAGGARGGGVRFDVGTSTPEDSGLWKGMSGAAVRDGPGRLVAVITDAHTQRQQRRLLATAVADIVQAPGFSEAARTVGQDPRLEDAGTATSLPGHVALGPVGRPIGELSDPFALEVHPAIEVGPPTGGAQQLPAYIERDHDERLRAIVQRAMRGTNTLAVLVGGSSTGKTRACWEAVRTLTDDWLLWHPIDPGRPDALLAALAGVRQRTVVWLNEIQHYLLTPTGPLGEQVAAGLRTLLQDTERAPVLLLGTAWPEYWDTLTTPPSPGATDPHAQARVLLTGHDIPVPEVFTDRDLQALNEVADSDSRLAYAALHAEQGQITQYLAGGPALIERYRTAPPAAKAVLETAMDARRLGHGPLLPASLLQAAAPGYLTDQQWEQIDDDWLEHALAYSTRPLRGARGPLTRVRPRPGDPSLEEPHYRLADYLEQHASTSRVFAMPPAAFWDAATLHVRAPHDLVALADAARRRWRRRNAAQLYLQAAANGDTIGLKALAEDREEAGEHEEAEQVARQAAAAGNDTVLTALAWIREKARAKEDAERLYQQAADDGDGWALTNLARLRMEAGDLEGAEHLARQAAEAGNTTALTSLAEMWAYHRHLRTAERLANQAVRAGSTRALGILTWIQEQSGQRDGAERLAKQAAEAGDTRPLKDLASHRHAIGHREDAERLYRQAADAGNSDAFEALLNIRANAGEWKDAEHIAQQAVDAGNNLARGILAQLRERAGERQEAERIAQQAAKAGDTEVLHKLAWMRDAAGDHAGAECLARQAAKAGDTGALQNLAWMRDAAGDHAGAECLARQAANTGNTDALRALAWIRDTAGKREDAMRLYRQAAAAGNTDALTALSWLHEKASEHQEAERLAQQAANAGDTDALRALARQHPQSPRWKQLLKYGLEPDGRTSKPWSVSDYSQWPRTVRS